MKNKINIRLVGIAILAIIATVIGITIVYYGLFQRQVRNDLAISAKLLKDTHYFEHVDINVDDIDLSTDMNELRVTWIDKDGTVLYDNDVTTDALSNHMDRPEIKDAFDSGEGQTVRKSDTLNKNTYYYAVLLDNGTVLRVATEAESLLSVFMSAAPIITLIVLIIIALCVAISQMLTKQLISPIEKMAKNLDNSDFESPYIELTPFAQTIREQHTDILSAAKARQDFTANVSHELKTPVAIISASVETMENNPREKKWLKTIKEENNRMEKLIKDLLDLSKTEDIKNNEVFKKVNSE